MIAEILKIQKFTILCLAFVFFILFTLLFQVNLQLKEVKRDLRHLKTELFFSQHPNLNPVLYLQQKSNLK